MPSEASGDMSQGDNTAENFGPGLEVSPVEQPISSETAAMATAGHQRADPATEAETVAGLTLQPQLIPAPAASEIIPEALPTSAAEEQPSMSVGEQLRGKATCESVRSVAPDQLTPPASQAIAAEMAAAEELQETAGQNWNQG